MIRQRSFGVSARRCEEPKLQDPLSIPVVDRVYRTPDAA